MKMTVNSLNTTANETQPANCINLSSLTLRNLGMTIAYGLLLVTSFSGNFLIVRVIYKIKTMRTTINFFIVNMAMSDLLFPVFVFPLLLTEIYTSGFGPLGRTICLVLFQLLYISSWVSIQSLILIALDRFVAVVFPLHSPIINSKLCPFVILTTWIVATASSFPMLVFYNSMEFSEKLTCGRIWFKKYFRGKILFSRYAFECSLQDNSFRRINYPILSHCFQAENPHNSRRTID